MPGYQVVQPAHALAEFATTFPSVFRRWQKHQKNLVVLAIANEMALMDLYRKADEARIRAVVFREPDIGNEATAIALEPCEATYRLVSSIPLALKENTGHDRKVLRVQA